MKSLRCSLVLLVLSLVGPIAGAGCESGDVVDYSEVAGTASATELARQHLQVGQLGTTGSCSLAFGRTNAGSHMVIVNNKHYVIDDSCTASFVYYPPEAGFEDGDRGSSASANGPNISCGWGKVERRWYGGPVGSNDPGREDVTASAGGVTCIGSR